jgi:DNA-binding CsgD family transcriptional regulator
MKISISHKQKALSAAAQVTEICAPLFDTTIIKYFDYEIFYDNGETLLLGSNAQENMYECYFGYDLYSTKEELLAFINTGMKFAFLSELLPLPSGAAANDQKKYSYNIYTAKNNNIYHRLYLVTRETEAFKLVGFGVTQDLPLVFEFFMNSLKKLEQFVNYFEEQAADLINEHNKANRIILPNYLTKANNIIVPGDKLFNSHLDNLTPRELECLSLAIAGYSAKEIGMKLNISYRTVERHIYNAKNILGSLSKDTIRTLLTHKK